MRRLALLVLLCATLVGCAAIADLAALQTRVQDAGYQNVSLYHRSDNGTDLLEITASGSDPDQVAEIVWDTYPEHVDQLSITLNGTQKVYSEAELREAFGERQVTVKPDDDTDVMKSLFTWLIVGAVVFLLFIIGLIILIVVLMRRSRRRKAQQQPYPGWPAGPPPAA
ncbi:hypothetical protein C8D88_105433 [Lentzea atacamensis]|uniref:DUF3153 domain-containing protein n=1 Tax=Lentzea atacamensis TaxID=531938 RepID=A0A316HYJ4_9PSEU|nr:hypothetical protein [Lentzea atacamensis]PWK86384.1 hypothetical protein C8D88_105433 [Lentzea atacamensis]